MSNTSNASSVMLIGTIGPTPSHSRKRATAKRARTASTRPASIFQQEQPALPPTLPTRRDGGSHVLGFGVVVLVHVVVGYALMSGLAQKVVETVRAPFEARLIEEIKEPPPPPPPLVRIKPIVKAVAPPPPFVPPPEVQVAAPLPVPTIAAITLVPPSAPVQVQPEAVAAPAPPPAPVPAAPQAMAIGVACPAMVAPVLPRRAQQDGIGGTVRARATIRGGKVVDVEILNSTPRGLFDAAVKTAMLSYGCNTSGTNEIVAIQSFQFRAAE